MTLPKITYKEISAYEDFFKIQSVSIENKGIKESVKWLKEECLKLNADEVAIWDDFGDFPVVMAKFNGHSDRTLLIYNHYDVQPVGDINLWKTSPFQPTIKNQQLFCRGASDCKGEIMTRLMMIDYYQKNGGLPCNILFFIEGEEEIGSPNLKNYIHKYRDQLHADACLWECGWKNEKEQLEISCGVKGILSFDLEVQTANQATHSSYAGIIQNPAWQLVQCLSSFKDDEGDITIKGFHDDITPLNNHLREIINKLDFDADQFQKNLSLKQPLIKKDYQTTLINEPTFNISQIQVGDSSSNNSIPAKATARIDCRFVPKQDPDNLLMLIEQHLKDNGFNNVVITNVHSEAAYRSDLSSPYVTQLIKSVEKIYGNHYQLIPNFAGGGPMSLIGASLKMPVVSLGCSYSGSNVHSPNENIRLADIEQTVHCLIDWIGNFSHS